MRTQSNIAATVDELIFSTGRRSSANPAEASPFMAALAAHHVRVGAMARRLARRLGISNERSRLIGDAATRHDTGKIFLRRKVYERPRPMTVREEADGRAHPILGHAALTQSPDGDLHLAARIALEHHEHWDGTGYPFGLRGEAICIEARIVTICDAYDVLRETDGHTHSEAMAIITNGNGLTRPTMFDPRLLTEILRDSGRFLDRVRRATARRVRPAT